MKRIAACIVAVAAVGAVADVLVVPTAVAQDKPAGKPDDKAPKKDDKPADKKTATADAWGTDYEKALATAKKDKKVVLADFTGSDWCGWCKKLKAEVFDTKEFQDWAKKNVVLLEVDFPRQKEQPKELKKQNEELQKKNKIEGYPTILFFDAKGEVVGKMGYQEGGPSKWTKDADAIIAKAKH